jgi:hypothetical protein
LSLATISAHSRSVTLCLLLRCPRLEGVVGVDEPLAATLRPSRGTWLAAAAADVDEAGQRRRVLVPAMPVLQAAQHVLQVDAVLEGLLQLLRELTDDRLGRLAVPVDVGADDLLRRDRRRRERCNLSRR